MQTRHIKPSAGEDIMSKHKCNYCDANSNHSRDALVDAGWSFVDIRQTIRKDLTACPQHFDNMKADIKGATAGTMRVKWSND